MPAPERVLGQRLATAHPFAPLAKALVSPELELDADALAIGAGQHPRECSRKAKPMGAKTRRLLGKDGAPF